MKVPSFSILIPSTMQPNPLPITIRNNDSKDCTEIKCTIFYWRIQNEIRQKFSWFTGVCIKNRLSLDV